MDIFTTLEERIEKVIAAHRELQARVATLEEENQRLREGATSIAGLEERLATFEAERASMRERLERLIALIGSVEA
ncbi:MAG TPA: cell division protein ZapB [Thermoanaerobaculaceae bacterium]|mgnify:CR=1 FL=1|nr:cell division protein ZapB [Thermoanaerobaculaceae bacterium]HPS77151.1 cell division protein ZapB [Thermoanaerobaculaceae bacterium]